KKVVKDVNPKKVIIQHGDEESGESFKKYLTQKGISVVLPKLGKKIDV
ncbi:MAG: MBL fold metallo-hydrolase RNA specificity domain-containing protein, partial [Candidatus Woesearchaeota archaeon]